jgi:hypothetical protein
MKKQLEQQQMKKQQMEKQQMEKQLEQQMEQQLEQHLVEVCRLDQSAFYLLVVLQIRACGPLELEIK